MEVSFKMKPKLFIGSSAESVAIAYASQQNLRHTVEVTVWDQGVFKLSSTTVESLLDVLDQSDFGMFVFSPDDLISIRGKDSLAVRDNVLFELGLFLGRLGRKRCFILVPEGETELRIATDLVGVTPGTYETDRSDGSLQAATAPACSAIQEAISKIGMRITDTESPGVTPQPEEKRVEAPTEAQAQKQAKSSTIEDEYAWLDAYIKRDYVNAAKLLEEKISEGPETMLPDLHGWLGRVKYAIDPSEGISYLEDLIKNDIKNPNWYTDLSFLYMRSDLYSDALTVLDRGLQVHPNNTSIVVTKVRCLKELGRPEEVVELLEAAIAQSAQEELYMSLAKHHAEQEGYDIARTCIERGISLLPSSLELLFSYAELLRDHFDKKISLVPFEKLVRLAPTEPKYLTLRANILLELDFNDLAMRDYQHANELAKEEQGWILGNIGNLYNNRGLYGDAIQYLKKALARDPESQYAHERMASAMLLSQQENENYSKLLKEARLSLFKSTAQNSVVQVEAEPVNSADPKGRAAD